MDLVYITGPAWYDTCVHRACYKHVFMLNATYVYPIQTLTRTRSGAIWNNALLLLVYRTPSTMTSFRMQNKGGTALKPMLAAFGGPDDDDGGAAASAGRGFAGGSGSAAPPAPTPHGSAEELRSQGVAAAQAGDFAGALHLFAKVGAGPRVLLS